MLSQLALVALLPVALVMLHQWRRCLQNLDGNRRMDRLVTVVWAPLFASVGLFGLLWDQQKPLHGQSSMAIGTGAMVFAILVGVLLLRRDEKVEGAGLTAPAGPEWFIPMAWPVAGVLMLMVGAAGQVSHVVGLVLFAIGLVLIWLNIQSDEDDASPAEPQSSDLNLVMAFIMAVLLAACVWLSPMEWLVPVGVLLALVSLAVFGLLARIRGAPVAVQAGGWFAVLLPCFGFGLLGQDMLSTIVQSDLRSVPPPRFEFTSSLLEPGLVLLLSVLVLAGVNRWTRCWQVPAAVALVVAGGLGFGVLMTKAIG